MLSVWLNIPLLPDKMTSLLFNIKLCGDRKCMRVPDVVNNKRFINEMNPDVEQKKKLSFISPTMGKLWQEVTSENQRK